MCQLMRRRVSTYAQACVNLCAGVCQLMRRLFFRVSTYAQVELGELAMCQFMRRRVSTYALESHAGFRMGKYTQPELGKWSVRVNMRKQVLAKKKAPQEGC